jgi:hypothetical protein
MRFFHSASSFSIRPESAKMADESATWQPWSDDYHDLQVSCSGGFSPSIADKGQPKIMSFVVQVRSTRNFVLLHYILLIPSNLLVLRRRGLKHM